MLNPKYFPHQGDVSNKESKDTKEGTAKKREGQTLRRSRRLSNESTEPSEPQPSQTGAAAPVSRRHSLRSAAAKASVNPFAEPIPVKRVVRKRTPKVVEPEKSSTAPSKGTAKRPLDASLEGPSPQKCTKKRGAVQRVDNADEITHVPPSTTERNLCNDILITADHGLQRIPFSTRQFTHGVAVYDEENKDDILHVPTYVTDIYQRLFNAEVRTLIVSHLAMHTSQTLTCPTFMLAGDHQTKTLHGERKTARIERNDAINFSGLANRSPYEVSLVARDIVPLHQYH